MKPRTQIYVLSGLLAALGGVVLYGGPGSPPIPGIVSGDEQYQRIAVEDPALRMDRLERIRKLAYPGMRRNIFSGELPPPPQPVKPAVIPQPVVPVNTEPPSVDIPLKFYGLAVDPRTGKRRAFFTNGEDVFIASEGDTLLTRFRLLRIGNTSADFEEVGTGLRRTLPLEQPVQAPQG